MLSGELKCNNRLEFQSCRDAHQYQHCIRCIIGYLSIGTFFGHKERFKTPQWASDLKYLCASTGYHFYVQCKGGRLWNAALSTLTFLNLTLVTCCYFLIIISHISHSHVWTCEIPSGFCVVTHTEHRPLQSCFYTAVQGLSWYIKLYICTHTL